MCVCVFFVCLFVFCFVCICLCACVHVWGVCVCVCVCVSVPARMYLHVQDLRSRQMLVDQVSEALHALSHGYHNLSDISYELAAPPPRQLLAQSLPIYQQPHVPAVVVVSGALCLPLVALLVSLLACIASLA